MLKKLIFVAPTVLFLLLIGAFVRGLGNDPSDIPSVLINRRVPDFSLPPLPGDTKGLSSEDLRGDVSLVNVFGSWCPMCLVEHPQLMKIHDSGFVHIQGLNWREKSPNDARRWLTKNGNPYTLVGSDPQSHVAIDFGVTGAPETFVVDRQGVIRYKHVGAVTAEVWTKTLKPLIKELRQ